MPLTFRSGKPTTAPYTPDADTAPGDVVVVNDAPRVAHAAIPAGTLGALAVAGGVYEGAADGAIGSGKRVFWDGTAGKFTLTAAGRKPFGWTLSAADADGDAISVLHAPGLAGPAAAITALTDASGGTANNTVQAIGGTYLQSEVANNFADVAGKINEIIAALRTAGVIAS